MRFRRNRRKVVRSSPSKKRVVSKALTKAKNQNIAKVVKRVLSRNVEIKCITDPTTYSAVSNITGSSTSIVGNYQVISPSNSTWGYWIPEGTANATRIGNRIKTKKFVFDYVVQPLPFNATTNPVVYPFYIRFYVFKNKMTPTADPTVAQITTKFFENGAGTVGLTGSVMDLNRKLCKDNFTYLTHWDHKIGYASNNQNGNNAFQHNNSNDFKMFANGSKDLTRFIAKEIVFDDAGNVNTPQTVVLWQIISTGPTTYSLTNFPCFVSTNINYYYTDA